MPAGHGVQVPAAEEVAPVWPYLPTAHKEPEHVKAPVICTNTNIHIHILYVVTRRRILCVFLDLYIYQGGLIARINYHIMQVHVYVMIIMIMTQGRQQKPCVQ